MLEPETPLLRSQLLAWWQAHGRREPEQKPWMFAAGGRFPDPGEALPLIGIWCAEVVVHACWGDPSSYRAWHGGFVGLLRSSAMRWSLLKPVGSLLESAQVDELFPPTPW